MDVILRVVYDGTTYDLDINQDIPLRVDISKVDNSKIGAVYGVGSQTFDLPGSRKNNRFFKHAYNVGADDVPAFYNTIDAYVLYLGETLLEGELQLNEIVTNEDGYITYKVQVYDTSVQFNTAIDGLDIKDADWSAYNHTLTANNITGSWANEGPLTGSYSSSIFYPIVDYGFDDPDQANILYPRVQFENISSSLTPLNLAQFLPAISLKDTLDVIFDQVGFTYTGSFQHTEGFDDLYILPKPKDELGVGAGVQNTFEARKTFLQIVSSPSTGTPTTSATIAFQDEISDPGSNYSTPTYTVPANGTYSFNSTINYSRDYGSDTVVREQLIIKKNGSQVAIDQVEVDRNDPLTGSLSVSFTNQTLSAADTLEVSFVLNLVSGTDTISDDYIVFGSDNGFTSFFSAGQAPISFQGATVDMSQQWEPLTKTLDVLKGIIDLFNLVIIPVEGSKTQLEIHTFDDWFLSGTQVDWTQKWDTSARKSITHPVIEQPKKLLFDYEEDEDRISKLALDSDPNYQYGTLEVIADNTISQGEEEVGSYFGPTVLASQTRSGSANLVFDSQNSFFFPHLYKFENSEQEAFKFKPRIGYKLSSPLPGTIYIGTPASNIPVSGDYFTLSNVNNLPATSTTKNLHFNTTYTSYIPLGNNESGSISQFDDNWKTYIDSLYWEDGRKVTLDVKFEQNEYRSIKLNDIIFIKDNQYRINKIKGFNLTDDDIATVELLKLYPAYVNAQVPVSVPVISPSPTPTVTASPGLTPSPTATNNPTPTVTVTPTPTPTVTASPGASATPTPTPTPTVTTSPGATVTPTPTVTPTITPTNSVTPTNTPTPTVTPSTGYSYYEITCCPASGCGGAYTDVRVTFGSGVGPNDSILMPDGCYTIEETTVAFSDEDYITAYVDCDECTSINPTPTPTPTPSSTPAASGCNEWELEGGSGGGNFSYTDCDSNPQTESVPDGDSIPVCALGSGPVLTSGNGTITLIGPCVTPTPTPTISVTPSVTPTISITPTISVTPSITPTISITPSVTPTISVTPTVTPSSTFTYYTLTNCGSAGGGYDRMRSPNGGAAPGDSVLMPDGCYEVDDALAPENSFDYINFYAGCTACESANPTPTPTPSTSLTPTPTVTASPGTTPTPTPTVSVTPSPAACYGIVVTKGNNTTDGCCTAPRTSYFDAATVASSTKLYDGFGCTTLQTGTKYVSEDQSVYYTFVNGFKFSGPAICPACP